MPRVAAIACLVWIGGLLLALLLDDAPDFLEWLILAVFLCISSGLAAFFVPKYWRRGPKPVFYLLMGLLALWAAFYYQLRSPQPSQNDISRILSKHRSSQEVIITGELISSGRINAKGNMQFSFKTEFIKPNLKRTVQAMTGNIYLTLPKELGENFSECQKLRVTGQLFPLSRNRHPGFSNFRPTNQDILVGLKGQKVDLIGQGFCWIPEWRSRIVQSQSQWLPKSERGEGLLISSIVLGQKAVSLPQELRDFFSRVGLSHILAASGYQVSLLVGTILILTQNLSRKSRF
ncbi:MAG: ComEC/Rec2 family competence protein, partial [Microcystaceae cyanobacterium]